MYVYIKAKAYDPSNAEEWEQESDEEMAGSRCEEAKHEEPVLNTEGGDRTVTEEISVAVASPIMGKPPAKKSPGGGKKGDKRKGSRR